MDIILYLTEIQTNRSPPFSLRGPELPVYRRSTRKSGQRKEMKPGSTREAFRMME
jgi:hypothetical protein